MKLEISKTSDYTDWKMAMKKGEIGKEDKRLRQGDLLISIIMASVVAVAIILITINIQFSLWISIPLALLVWVGIAYLNYSFMYEKKYVSKK